MCHRCKSNNISISYSPAYSLKEKKKFANIIGLTLLKSISKKSAIHTDLNHTIIDATKKYLLNVNIGFTYYVRKSLLGFGFQHTFNKTQDGLEQYFYYTDNIPFYLLIKFPLKT